MVEVCIGVRFAESQRAMYLKTTQSVAVCTYRLGGYQVLKKQLSCREHAILSRALTLEEVQHFTNTARGSIAILMIAWHDHLVPKRSPDG